MRRSSRRPQPPASGPKISGAQSSDMPLNVFPVKVYHQFAANVSNLYFGKFKTNFQASTFPVTHARCRCCARGCFGGGGSDSGLRRFSRF